jgi:hypothetical protein
MLDQPLNVSIKALDVVPSGMGQDDTILELTILIKLLLAQRSLNVFDRKWNEHAEQ